MPDVAKLCEPAKTVRIRPSAYAGNELQACVKLHWWTTQRFTFENWTTWTYLCNPQVAKKNVGYANKNEMGISMKHQLYMICL